MSAARWASGVSCCSHSTSAAPSRLMQEGEQTWLLAGRLGAGGLRRPAAELAPPATAEDGSGMPAHHEVHDVPAEELADEDSQFLEDCQGLQVHYKMALPQVRRGPLGALD